MPENKKEQVLSVRDLDITFKTTAGPVHAIRGVNIDLYKGETVALVGESGSGKSVTMKAAMGILAKNATVNSGSIQFSYHHADGSPETVDLLQKDKKWIRRHINGKRIAMVFQDPMTSLDPTMTIGKQIMEGMLWHFKMPKAEAYKKALELLEEVGITDAEKRMKNYPPSAVRRYAPARGHCHCALLRPRPAHLRRAHHRAGCDHSGKNSGADPPHPKGARHLGHLHYPRPWRCGKGGRLCGRDVRRQDCGDRHHRRDLLRPQAPLYMGPAVALPDLDTADDRLYTIPGSPPNLLHGEARRCLLHPATALR